ncbi:hypothetical protein [Mycobacterium marinum]|uniref:hypothetical protein n=1 Tax=Mycobacterium marinum TaxID=1781 RepID=UPI0023580E98|nr:hypothetical protein [Mycobacterium marinum]MDC8985519.1 hypothetical protein [Mycobacterium marinum]MDC9002837.1 hypothetical protein [Mycobacterium marinum]MDC9013556.1 hypothetical protein [Mycobacterium marinum]MDC9018906.1 hypothetical protein [Mycobacterium marinum]
MSAGPRALAPLLAEAGNSTARPIPVAIDTDRDLPAGPPPETDAMVHPITRWRTRGI